MCSNRWRLIKGCFLSATCEEDLNTCVGKLKFESKFEYLQGVLSLFQRFEIAERTLLINESDIDGLNTF